MKEQIIKSTKRPEKIVVVNQEGKVVREKSYQDGKLNGPINLYWDDGRPRLTGKFENNIRIGDWTHFDPEGNIILEEIF